MARQLERFREAIAAGMPRVGWKIGINDPAAQERIGLSAPIVGWIARDAGITATTMASVMVGCAVIGCLSLWLIVRPRTVQRLAP